ncbi:MAG: DUF1338 domain-containing protein [Planctomycetes bacterium]|nr:DUF1338 domain-containing protein [Planctomycetota bacterium]
MMNALFDVLWQDYISLNPQAESIKQILADRGDSAVNDHIALRTINEKHCDIDQLAQPFIEMGYAYSDTEYIFHEKHLRARHLFKEASPLVFISSLQLSDLSAQSAKILGSMVEGHKPDVMSCARPWECSIEDYELLQKESEYGAWFAAFAWRANHFTIDVNALNSFEHIDELCVFLQAQGYQLNESGGIIKGLEEQGLRQASTMAARQVVEFSDGELEIPTCYVEFAQRYEIEGKIFREFIAASADKIFESTDS